MSENGVSEINSPRKARWDTNCITSKKASNSSDSDSESHRWSNRISESSPNPEFPFCKPNTDNPANKSSNNSFPIQERSRIKIRIENHRKIGDDKWKS